MRIGFDVDGVVAKFTSAYERKFIELTGKDLFHPDDPINPPVWDWPEYRGYTKKEKSAVWKSIALDETFWFMLEPLPGARDLDPVIADLEINHDVYWVTARPGKTAKSQTEDFLYREFGGYSTVLICKEKGLAARALELDVYIDDKFENVLDVCEQSPKTRVYLLNYNYNQADDMQYSQYHYTRVYSVQEMLEREHLI